MAFREYGPDYYALDEEVGPVKMCAYASGPQFGVQVFAGDGSIVLTVAGQGYGADETEKRADARAKVERVAGALGEIWK